MGGQAITRPSDRDLAALAAAQHGLVTRTQLLSRGWPSGAIEHRVAEGRLLVRQRGVYSVGGAPPTRESGWMAAVLATGAGSVLSHRSAAALWGLGNDQDPVPEVTTPALRRRPGIRVHRSRLAPAERTLRGRIPVTTPARTLLDLAAVLGPRDLERAIPRGGDRAPA